MYHNNNRKTYTKWDTLSPLLQTRTLSYLTDCSTFMRRNKRFNSQKLPHIPSAPSILPWPQAEHIMELMDVYCHLNISWGRLLLKSFMEAETAALLERTAARQLLATPSPTTTPTSAPNNVMRARRAAAKTATQNATSTRTGGFGKTAGSTATKDIHSASYDSASGMYKCHFCTNIFGRNTLGPHMKLCQKQSNCIANAGASGFNQCSMCLLEFQRDDDFQAHCNSCKTRKSSSSSSLTCDFCSQVSHLSRRNHIYKTTYDVHCRSVLAQSNIHPQSNQFVCSKCDKYVSVNHKCNKTAVDLSTKWVCVCCRLYSKRTHIFENAYLLQNHNEAYHYSKSSSRKNTSK